MSDCVVKKCSSCNCEDILKHNNCDRDNIIIKSADTNNNDRCISFRINSKLLNSLFCNIEIENQEINMIASYLVSRTLFIFYNIKNTLNNKHNILCIISAEIDINNNIIKNTLHNQMYFSIYYSAKHDGLCKHLARKLNIVQIVYDIYLSKFILVFEFNDKIIFSSLEYLMSIHSVATDMLFIKNNDCEFLCINGKSKNLSVTKKNTYKLLYCDTDNNTKSIILTFI